MDNMSDMNMDDMDAFDFESIHRPGTPMELIEAAAADNLLPSKSKTRYQQTYNNFLQWKEMKGATSSSERVLMAYFEEMAGKCLPTTLWARYSMLKSTMKINERVDISTYPQLVPMLKNKSKGHVTKQAKSFTEIEVQTFIDNAPDVAWLDVKVT